MSDDTKSGRPSEHEEPQDEVDAHSHMRKGANDEPAQDGDDEVEAHSHIRKGEPDNKMA
jgi:hypothetical protein